jgi:cell division septation protein DedD
MFSSRHRSKGSSANRWLIVAGAGLVILAFVARMLLDIGHAKVSDLTGVLGGAKPARAADSAPVPTGDTAPAPAPAPATVPVQAQPAAPAVDSVPKVAPPPPVAHHTTPPTPASPAGTGYSVQIGAFSSEANATKLVARSSALGYQARIVPQPRGNGTLFLVRVADLPGADAARHTADSLARGLGVKAVVLPPGR